MTTPQAPTKTRRVLERIQSLKDLALSSEAITEELGSLRLEIESLRKDRNSLQSEMEGLSRRLRSAEEELDDKEKARKREYQRSRSLAERVLELEREQEETGAFQTDLEKATARADRLEATLDEAEAEKGILAERVEDLERALEESQLARAGLEADVIAAKEAARQLESKLLDRDERTELRDLREERKKAELALRTLVKQVEKARGERDEARRALEAARTQRRATPPAPAAPAEKARVMARPAPETPAAPPAPPAPPPTTSTETTVRVSPPVNPMHDPPTDTIPSRNREREGAPSTGHRDVIPTGEPVGGAIGEADPQAETGDIVTAETQLRGLISHLRGEMTPPRLSLAQVKAAMDRASELPQAGTHARTEDIGSAGKALFDATAAAPAGTAAPRPSRGGLAFLFDPEEPPENATLTTVRQVVRSYLAHLKRDPGEALHFPYSDEPASYLRHHSHNVCKLAMHLGLYRRHREEDVLTLGLAAILHDIGMAEVPDSIVRKKDALTETEMRWIREHPTIGGRLLEALEGVDKEVVQIVRQHHERIDGSGYPEGLRGSRIHEFARIINLVDGYEAMSAPRVYRDELLPNETMRVIANPLVIAQAVDLPGKLAQKDIHSPSPSRAMEQVIMETPTVYDPPLVRDFLLCMGFYPVGSYVRLSTGEIARVVRANGEEIRRPVVKVILDAEGHVPTRPILIDTVQNPRIGVSHAVSGVPYEGLA